MNENITVGKKSKLLKHGGDKLKNSASNKFKNYLKRFDYKPDRLFYKIKYATDYKYFITIKLQHNEDVTTLLQMKEFWITGTSKTPVKHLKFKDDPEYNYEDYEIIYDGGVIE